jgi:hypothetical protein
VKDSCCVRDFMPVRTVLGVLIAIALLGCSATVRVRSAPDPPPSLRGYRTYGWISRDLTPGERRGSSFAAADARIRGEVERRLDAKGYRHRTLTAPDFLIAYRVSIEEKNAESFRDLYSYHRAGGKAGIQEAFAQGFEEGVLALEIIDARTRRTLWRASAAAVLGPDAGRDRVAEAVRLIVDRLPDAER